MVKSKKEIFLRRKAKAKLLDARFFGGQEDDIVIPVMGPTGVGKSTFINNVSAAFGGTAGVALVGHALASCTAELQPVAVQYGDKRLIIVDTPGFDDTYVDDAVILERISVWLAASYSDHKKLSGVVYLYDISQTRMLGTTRKNLQLFRKLCGDDALACVTLGTTKWEILNKQNDGDVRESQLSSDFWKEMIASGSTMARVYRNQESARLIIEKIIKGGRRREDIELLIQQELVDMEKFIPDTEAGQELRYTIKQLLEMQKRRGNTEEVRKALAQLKKLNVPFLKRLMAVFGVQS